MCTAVTYKSSDFYFGRTLDYDFSYGEEIVIMPRNYELDFINMGTLKTHYAIIGTAHVENNYPLFYDAVNEKGLSAAGLNFVGNAYFRENIPGKDNIAQFEFIPWLLSKCADISEAEILLKKINITKTPFSEKLPASPLHWIIADKNRALTVESVSDGIHIYDNPVGVLTNNPPFNMQLFRLNDYMQLSPKSPSDNFSDKLVLSEYSRGMGALGLPGDWSSQSRFIRAAFTALNSTSDKSETASVSQFFHILSSVEQPRGCCRVNDSYEITIYSSCYNTDKGIYYCTTYENRQISAVYMHHENLDSEFLKRFPMIHTEKIDNQN